jgi:hypothetical protein
VLVAASAFAREQHGVVAWRQLAAAGASTSAVSRAVRDGRLVRLHRGVYAVGHRALRREGVWLAAVLAGGPGAVLSHRSACALWGICAEPAMGVDITVPRDGARGRRGIRAHRCRLHSDDVTVKRGIAVTTPMRALLDAAEDLSARGLDRAVEQSERLRLFNGFQLPALLERAGGRCAAARLAKAVARYDDNHEFTRSTLEDLALDLVRDHGVPRPVVNAKVGEYEVDLLWSAERVVVEADSWTFHGTRAAFERDRQRDADLQARGYRVLRVTWRQARDEAAWIAARLRDVLALGAS